VHNGRAAGAAGGNLTILERLQQQLSQSHQSIRDEKNRLLIVESQLKFTQQASSPALGATLPSSDGGPKTLEDLSSS